MLNLVAFSSLLGEAARVNLFEFSSLRHLRALGYASGCSGSRTGRLPAEFIPAVASTRVDLIFILRFSFIIVRPMYPRYMFLAGATACVRVITSKFINLVFVYLTSYVQFV